jgi:hypothetical protein
MRRLGLPRVLATGSRNWPSPDRIRAVLVGLSDHYGGPVLLVHGGAKGADVMAHAVALELGWPEPEVHRPDYTKYGRYRAPIIRDEEMARSGIDYCVAFIARCEKDDCPSRGVHGSHGATYTADYAADLRVPVDRYVDPPEAAVLDEERRRRL